MSDLQRLTQLEEALMHQQRLLDELNTVVTGLRMELDAVLLAQRRLESACRDLQAGLPEGGAIPDEKPPHY